MNVIELARRMAQLGETGEALRAYALALGGELSPADALESAIYTLQNGGDYKLAYTALVSLYNAGYRRADVLSVLRQAFYEPNVKPLKNRYERNCKLLAKYPYLFRRDFPTFDELPLVFYPYDDNGGYVPFSKTEDKFLGYLNPNDPVIGRNFFKDLEKPILADDVTSQYELEYLHDNVRPSEWVGRENHIYLHYRDWGEFCAWLQIWNLKPLLEDKKFVFLIGDELTRYPIDFKAEFGVDYSQHPVRPFGIREINKLIWHTQLSSHNGGDFFNEVFDRHPNLLSGTSVMFDGLEASVATVRNALEAAYSRESAQRNFTEWDMPDLVDELYDLRNVTEKDILVALYLRENSANPALDRASRIAPALFLQPHYGNVEFNISEVERGVARLTFGQADYARESKLFRDFKYVKTFTPVRRPTTSSAATIRFEWAIQTGELNIPPENAVVSDELSERVFDRLDLRDPDDRCYHDAVLVRFEDGKLNPKATFSALTGFLDIPYAQSMEYCSQNGVRDPAAAWEKEHQYGLSVGFDTKAVYKTYEEYMGASERCILEYFLRDLYERCGYDFQWYDGAPMDATRLDTLLSECTTLDGYIRESFRRQLDKRHAPDEPLEQRESEIQHEADEMMEPITAHRCLTMRFLLSQPRIIGASGKELEPIPLLQPDPALLEAEIYH